MYLRNKLKINITEKQKSPKSILIWASRNLGGIYANCSEYLVKSFVEGYLGHSESIVVYHRQKLLDQSRKSISHFAQEGQRMKRKIALCSWVSSAHFLSSFFFRNQKYSQYRIETLTNVDIIYNVSRPGTNAICNLLEIDFTLFSRFPPSLVPNILICNWSYLIVVFNLRAQLLAIVRNTSWSANTNTGSNIILKCSSIEHWAILHWIRFITVYRFRM